MRTLHGVVFEDYFSSDRDKGAPEAVLAGKRARLKEVLSLRRLVLLTAVVTCRSLRLDKRTRAKQRNREALAAIPALSQQVRGLMMPKEVQLLNCLGEDSWTENARGEKEGAADGASGYEWAPTVLMMISARLRTLWMRWEDMAKWKNKDDAKRDAPKLRSQLTCFLPCSV